MTDAAMTSGRGRGMTKDERFVVLASSTGTVFEWYDFYLYATLAPFFAAVFFPPSNATAALLSAFATYAAGFLVRPFGALIFGRIGDLVAPGPNPGYGGELVVTPSAKFIAGQFLQTSCASRCFQTFTPTGKPCPPASRMRRPAA